MTQYFDDKISDLANYHPGRTRELQFVELTHLTKLQESPLVVGSRRDFKAKLVGSIEDRLQALSGLNRVADGGVGILAFLSYISANPQI